MLYCSRCLVMVHCPAFERRRRVGPSRCRDGPTRGGCQPFTPCVWVPVGLAYLANGYESNTMELSWPFLPGRLFSTTRTSLPAACGGPLALYTVPSDSYLSHLPVITCSVLSAHCFRLARKLSSVACLAAFFLPLGKKYWA